MRRLLAATSAAAMSAALVMIGPATASAAARTTCQGALPAGTYGTVVVPTDTVCFAQAFVRITGGLYVRQGATFALGSDEDPTPSGVISGGVHATNAANVQIHHARINGGIRIHGGSGPFYAATPFCSPDETTGETVCLTWNAIEEDHINGAVVIDGYNGFWQGFLENHVNGSVRFNNNVLVDPDGNELVTNVIHGSLSCHGNSPAPQAGDSGGTPNVVSGAQKGQCAG